MLALQRISKQLAVADVDEAVDLRRKAAAIAHYSRTAKHCRQIEWDATVIRLRCERRLGKLLASRVKRGNPKVTQGDFSLPDGITKNQSSQWQLVAKVPAKQFEEYLEGCRPTTKGLVRLGREAVRKRQRGPDIGGNILTGDMWQLHSRLEDSSVDLFLTDPPYADMSAYERLAELAAKKLKPDGLCLAYSGQYHLPEVLAGMSKHLPYFWTFAVAFTGKHSAIHPRKIQSAWKPILAYGKPRGWVTDLLHGGGLAKADHEWQQPESEAEYLIRKLTQPGDLVVDPFCGSGTVLLAASKLNRRFLGTEIDKNTAKGARRRLAA